MTRAKRPKLQQKTARSRATPRQAVVLDGECVIGTRPKVRALVTDLPVWVYGEAVVGIIFGDHVTGVEQYNTGTLLMDRIGKK